MRLYGVDFTSAPSRRKAITIAQGELHANCVRLSALSSLHDFSSFEDWLRQPTLAREQARRLLLAALEKEGWRGLQLDCSPYRAALVADASGDLMDAALCLIAAAWAWQRREHAYGLPDLDPLEGWILGA